jgi:hypothetical protein
LDEEEDEDEEAEEAALVLLLLPPTDPAFLKLVSDAKSLPTTPYELT